MEIRTQNLCIGYRTKKQELVIAEAITINIKNNGFYALIGNNGTGKSTFIRSLCRLQEVLSGTILINNKPLTNYTANELAKQISFVSTERIPSSNLSVYELIALGRQAHTNWLGALTKNDKKIIEKALIDTNIVSLQNKKINTLSDGQLQQIMIARALAQNTPFIVLDEPTTYLDLENKTMILLLLKKLAKTKTIIIATHEINSILPLADELLISTNNKIIQGKIEEKTIQNVLKNLFSDKFLNFDTKTCQFYVKKQ